MLGASGLCFDTGLRRVTAELATNGPMSVTVVKVSGLDEDVRVEQIPRQSNTPASRSRLLKVSTLETPTMRKASR